MRRVHQLLIVAGIWAGSILACESTTDQAALPETDTIPPIEILATETVLPTESPFMTEKLVAEQDGMEMILISEGEFLMGSLKETPYSETDEYPIHLVFVDSYWIDSTEVTNQMFAEFLNANLAIETEGQFAWFDAASPYAQIIYHAGVWKPKLGFENHPVIEVNWFAADAYCSWAGRRLPTEAEWEKAARGTDSRLYPWGDSQPTCELAMFDSCGNASVAVGGFPAGQSPYGVFDMAGNVWEWVADHYDSEYYQYAPYSNPQGSDKGGMVVRGGAWTNSFWGIRTAGRGQKSVHESFSNLGFRCAMGYK